MSEHSRELNESMREPSAASTEEVDASNVVENTAPRCQSCIECDDRSDDVSPGAPSWDNIIELQAPRELVEFPGLTKTGERHIAEPDGILAQYAFDVEVSCSLKGDHKHKQGLVVKTLCGLVLCMGRQCGRKSIVGFDGILHSSARRRQYHADLRTIDNWVAIARVRRDEVSRNVLRCSQVSDTLKTHLPALYAELSSRRARRAHGEEVHLPRARSRADLPTELGRSSDTARLKGLCILDNQNRALTKLDGMIARFVELEREAPPLDGPAAGALRAIATNFADQVQRLDEWCREASAFITEENLHVALVALNRDSPRVARVSGGWRISYMPGESALLPNLFL